MSDELEIAKNLSVQAGAILLKHFAEKTPVRWKGKNNPVTDADQAASRFIVDELRRRFPRDGILCEEEQDDANRLSRYRVWIIDPMDGTSEFVAGRTEFAVMIGLVVDGKPFLGVVYQPAEQKLYYAESRKGAFLESSAARIQLQVSQEAHSNRATIVASRSHDSTASQRVRQMLAFGGVIHVGSVGLKAGLICEGRAHLYLHMGPGTNQWDTCAPEIILQESGGRMTDVFNKPLHYNTPAPQNMEGIIASNGLLHDRAVEAVRVVLSTGPAPQRL
jgi:3'(2'),5'-bisphosphate nucleotidase